MTSTPLPLPLSLLLGDLPHAPAPRGPDPLIRGLAYDSRKVRPGDLFVCLRGAHDDGHRHVGDAIRRGAVAILAERSVEGLDGLPLVTVPDSRHELARTAARFSRGWAGAPRRPGPGSESSRAGGTGRASPWTRTSR